MSRLQSAYAAAALHEMVNDYDALTRRMDDAAAAAAAANAIVKELEDALEDALEAHSDAAVKGDDDAAAAALDEKMNVEGRLEVADANADAAADRRKKASSARTEGMDSMKVALFGDDVKSVYRAYVGAWYAGSYAWTGEYREYTSADTYTVAIVRKSFTDLLDAAIRPHFDEKHYRKKDLKSLIKGIENKAGSRRVKALEGHLAPLTESMFWTRFFGALYAEMHGTNGNGTITTYTK